MQRQILVTSDEQLPDHLRLISIDRSSVRAPLLPQQMSAQLVELSVLLLSFDYTTVDWYATQVMHQLGGLSASYSATPHLCSLPLFRRPLLLIVVSCLERLPRVKPAIRKLQRVTALMQATPASEPPRDELRPKTTSNCFRTPDEHAGWPEISTPLPRRHRRWVL